MSTFDATVSLLRELPEEELSVIYDLAARYVNKRQGVYPYKKLTETEIIDSLDTARKHSDEGSSMDADTAVHMLREKYGL